MHAFMKVASFFSTSHQKYVLVTISHMCLFIGSLGQFQLLTSRMFYFQSFCGFENLVALNRRERLFLAKDPYLNIGSPTLTLNLIRIAHDLRVRVISINWPRMSRLICIMGRSQNLWMANSVCPKPNMVQAYHFCINSNQTTSARSQKALPSQNNNR